MAWAHGGQTHSSGTVDTEVIIQCRASSDGRLQGIQARTSSQPRRVRRQTVASRAIRVDPPVPASR